MPSGPRTPRERTTYHHGALREALLAGAREMLAERGLDGFSLSALARRLGVSTAAPYRHFADRDALLDALCLEGYALFGAALARAARTTDDPREVLHALGVAYLTFAREHPSFFAIMFTGRSDATIEAGAPTFEPLVQAVLAAQQAGALPAGTDPRVLSRTLWATLHGLAVLSRQRGFVKLGLDDTDERLVADAFALALR
ncbi:transcriptional regulator, TetR family [Cellulomonas flavigena DSM 20109]|uniref:Transcriptional regulator, TetR family n=1 Tax=Cellulomonas flavigena (strain ATCC 482 / DSM 20109 / BCRC 11376 / JCM 18109 / NBRC 3775 / NCIMB 8073 / NRS 134) TaxID=446466 RepID=D5UGJ8_CELFN|nr:TetR/AcrR family transcriptional regulator [Cellulomonas flavigena]ADG73181.1 transcriptional regulator, TetR family [Cellulomonas flavigena DSM 20109]